MANVWLQTMEALYGKEYAEQLKANGNRMAEKHRDLRQHKFYGAYYTEFGTLTHVDNREGWIHLHNDQGLVICMKKVYMRWAAILRQAQAYEGKEIIYETGASASPFDYFRDIWPENENPEFSGYVFDMPKDINDEGLRQLLMTRLNRNHLRYVLDTYKEQNESLKHQVEQLSATEIKEVATASEQLDECWDDFRAAPRRSFMIAGQAMNKSPSPKKIDVMFAFRMGIDLTKRNTKRIHVEVKERISNTNKMRCLLPDYDNSECIIGIKQSTHNRTKGEWAAVHVENTLPGWFDIENSKEYKDIKNQRQPIAYFLKKNEEVIDRLIQG